MTATILLLDRHRRSVQPALPPFDIDRVIAAALRRAARLSTADHAFVDALATRRRVLGHERAALVRIADALNLGARDRG